MADKTQYWSKPKKARVDRGQAWWYANKGSIEIYVISPQARFTVRLSRKALADYVRRSATKKS